MLLFFDCFFVFSKEKFEFNYNLLYKLVAAGFLIAAHWFVISMHKNGWVRQH